ncbi:MAG: hypothetical protein QY321_00525 [Patescibacteria group bacterium]|nr:MAG: hypothetical protein QY321_00525 [Patescibacteria group bacterium]
MNLLSVLYLVLYQPQLDPGVDGDIQLCGLIFLVIAALLVMVAFAGSSDDGGSDGWGD